MRTELVTVVAGQDGLLFAELQLAKGYQVHGMIRRSSSIVTHRIDGIYPDAHDGNGRCSV